jgi:hypothetical protein
MLGVIVNISRQSARGRAKKVARDSRLTGAPPPFAGDRWRRARRLRKVRSATGESAGGRAEMIETKERGWGSPGRLVIGVYLLAIGALLLASNLGYDVPGELWSYWPFLLLGLGAVKLLWPESAEERAGGFWLVATGAYAWISIWNLFGLDWGSAWPLFLVAGGLAIVFRGFGCRSTPQGSENRVG